MDLKKQVEAYKKQIMAEKPRNDISKVFIKGQIEALDYVLKLMEMDRSKGK